MPMVRTLIGRLKRSKHLHKGLDDTVHALHHEVFAETDCLTCANCCKTTSPAIYPNDVERLARHLRMKETDVATRYLKLDTDGSWMVNAAPCPFLGADNYCSVYEARPTACREYPHTDRKRIVQLLDLTERNAAICPAVLTILERLGAQLETKN